MKDRRETSSRERGRNLAGEAVGGSSHAKEWLPPPTLRPSGRCSSDRTRGRCAKKQRGSPKKEGNRCGETATSTCLDIRNSTANPQGRPDRKNAATEPSHQTAKRSISIQTSRRRELFSLWCTYPVTSLETGTIIDRRFDPTRCPCLSRLSPSLSISCSRGGKDRIMRERE